MDAMKRMQTKNNQRKGAEGELSTLGEEEQLYRHQIYQRLRRVSKSIALERDFTQFTKKPFTFHPKKAAGEDDAEAKPSKQELSTKIISSIRSLAVSPIRNWDDGGQEVMMLAYDAQDL